MVGLRTQENMKFLAFFKLVQEAASELNSVFFLDSGEGNLFKDDNIECEDLSGWLIEKKDADEFRIHFDANEDIPEKWDSCGTFVSWENIDGRLKISFD